MSADEALRGTARVGRVDAEGRALGKDPVTGRALGNEPVVARGVRGSSGSEPGGAGTANGANSACVPFGIGASGEALGNPPVAVRGSGGFTTVSSIHAGRLACETDADVRCAAGASTRVSADFADPSGSTVVALSSDQGSAAGDGADAAASSQVGTDVCVGMDGRGNSFVTLGAAIGTGTAVGGSTDVESDHGEGAIAGADARGLGNGTVVRGSGTGPDGAGGNNPEAAVKGDPFPFAKGEKIGPDGRGGAPGALGRGVGAAAPFFQVSATEHPPQRSVASGGPATTSGGSGSSHSGHAGVSLTTRASANPPATST